MKTRQIIFALLLLIGGVTVVGDEKPWFDLEKCAFCKTLAAEPGLVDHMETEYHDVTDGIISVTYIDPAYKDAFARAQANMGKVVQSMQAGVMPVMCTHCETMGLLFQAGCRQEGVQSRECIIMLYTSHDSAMVARIREFGHKSAEAMTKIKSKEK